MLDPEEAEHPVPCSCHMTKCILIKTVMLQQDKHMNQTNKENSNVLEDEKIDDD